MRCLACSIDLAEEARICPLCGQKASPEAPVLEGIPSAPYPKYNPEAMKAKQSSDFPQKHILRIALLLCVGFGVAALCGHPAFWQLGTPLLFITAAVSYFVIGCREKGRLLHAGVALLSCAAVQVPLLLVPLYTKTGFALPLITLALTLALWALLWAFRPTRMRAQLQALFHL